MIVHEETLAARLLWKRYPRHDGFIRHLRFSWSAEIVAPGQPGPPYRTYIVAEAGTIAELLALLEKE